MAKDVGKAIQRSSETKRSNGINAAASRSLSVGFKKDFSQHEQVEIRTKRRELRDRLVATG